MRNTAIIEIKLDAKKALAGMREVSEKLEALNLQMEAVGIEHCDYCKSTSISDYLGNCGACGAPRECKKTKLHRSWPRTSSRKR